MSGPGEDEGDLLPKRRPSDPAELVAAAYEQSAEGLYRYALMILADHAAAEDAVQQAFAKLLRMGAKAANIRSCGDYLRTAVRHECWEILRQRRRASEPLDNPGGRALLEPVNPAGIDEDERLQLEAAIRSLPPEQREVLYLKVYDGRTFEQIASWTGVSINTAASRYRYALEKLRERLGT